MFSSRQASREDGFTLTNSILSQLRRWTRAKAAAIGRHRNKDRQPSLIARKPWLRGKGWQRMGQDSSTPVDESTPPQTLQSRTLDGVAAYIRDGKAKRIVVMVRLQ